MTANAILAQAAALDGNEVKSYDQTGAAQKWGAVLSSLIIAAPDQPSITNRVGLARADLYLALDLLAGVDCHNLSCCNSMTTHAVINTGLLPNGEMIRDPRLVMQYDKLVDTIRGATRGADAITIDALRIAENLFGDYMMANMVAIGAAYQAGLLPISARSVETAIRLNGTQEEANLLAFRTGRLSQFDPDRLAGMLARPYTTLADRLETGNLGAKKTARLDAIMEGLCHLSSDTLKSQVRLRAGDLIRYQDINYAQRYALAVDAVAKAERAALGSAASLEATTAVARNLHKVMAYKDEYEVAGLLAHPTFSQRVAETFTGPTRIFFNLQPPFLRSLGLKGKLRVGGWIRPALQALARLKFLRGTAFDPFGYLEVRRQERSLVTWYMNLIEESVVYLTPSTSRLVCELLSLPEQIRGYEQVKEKAVREAKQRAVELNRQLQVASQPQRTAA